MSVSTCARPWRAFRLWWAVIAATATTTEHDTEHEDQHQQGHACSDDRQRVHGTKVGSSPIVGRLDLRPGGVIREGVRHIADAIAIAVALFGRIVREGIHGVTDTVAVAVTFQHGQGILDHVGFALTADGVRLDVEGIRTLLGTDGQAHVEIPHPVVRTCQEHATSSVVGPACGCRTKHGGKGRIREVHSGRLATVGGGPGAALAPLRAPPTLDDTVLVKGTTVVLPDLDVDIA